MSNDESFPDRMARKLEQGAESIAEGQRGSAAFTEIDFAADKTTGDYPQTSPTRGPGNFQTDGGHYHNRFPEPLRDPLEFVLKRKAKWTDVMSSTPFSQGYLLNSRALAEFERFELGNVKRHAATVTDSRGTTQQYSYLFVINHLELADIDFTRSLFHIVDMVSQPLFPIEVTSSEEFWRLMKQAQDGELKGSEKFSRITFQKLVFSPGHAPRAAIFGLGRLGSKFYVSSQFGEALVVAGISGLEFKPNTRLFVSES